MKRNFNLHLSSIYASSNTFPSNRFCKRFGLFLGVIVATLFNFSSAGQNAVSLDESNPAVTYNPMIFGHFLEHFDNQVYGGIFDPESPLSDEDGFRTDVLEALKEIKVPIVRWPGGCFVSTYHWVDGIGPERTPVYDKTWQVEDPNTFGTDEYILWCRKLGCEPYICTNAGTGTPEEMSDWVEYCNLNMGKWGRKRIANGHPEPYNVKYWSVGNENWGGHELGARTVEEWGPLVRESSKLMRSVTKDAKLVAAATSDRNWTLPLLRAAGYNLDYVAVHGYWDPLYHYNNPAPYLECMMKTEFPENDICNTIEILEEAGFGEGRIKIAYDEWNLRNWHHPFHGDFRRGFILEDRRKNDIASTYTMADALFSACFLNACLRHSDIVDIACFAPVVNTRGPIFVYPEGILKRITYYVFHMYTNLLQQDMIPIQTEFNTLKSEDGRGVCMVDAVLTANPERTKYTLAVVNKDPEKSQPLDLSGLKLNLPKKIYGMVLTGSSPDDYNDIGDEERVIPKETEFKGNNSTVALPPHSLTMLTLTK